MKLEDIPPLERKLIIWEHEGIYYTPEELIANPEALKSLEEEVFKTLSISEEKLHEITKKRLIDALSKIPEGIVLKTLSIEGPIAYTPDEIIEFIKKEEGIGKKLLEAEKERVLDVLSMLAGAI